MPTDTHGRATAGFRQERAALAALLAATWETDPRWAGITRPYDADAVIRLRGSVAIDPTLARRGAERLHAAINGPGHVAALGAVTGNQAVQMVKAGLQSVYVSGWQIAADANTAGVTYPDLGLYPVDSAPRLVRRVNQALGLADRMQCSTEDGPDRDWYVPIVADAEAGFGGVLNTFEVVTQLIEAGAAGVHLEDQSSADRRCGLMAGKILVPTAEFIDKLVAARLAADVAGAPTVIIARTDALQATVLTSDADTRDQPYIRGRRAEDGYFDITPGMESAITRGLAYAPYADLLWCESMRPDLADAEAFAAGIHREFPGKPLAFNCTIGPDWADGMSAADIEAFQQRAAQLGYRYQFITIAGFHSLNAAAFELAAGYRDDGLTPYVKLLDRERELAAQGFTAVDFQNEVGAAHYEAIGDVVRGARRSRTNGAATRR